MAGQFLCIFLTVVFFFYMSNSWFHKSGVLLYSGGVSGRGYHLAQHRLHRQRGLYPSDQQEANWPPLPAGWREQVRLAVCNLCLKDACRSPFISIFISSPFRTLPSFPQLPPCHRWDIISQIQAAAPGEQILCPHSSHGACLCHSTLCRKSEISDQGKQRNDTAQ